MPCSVAVHIELRGIIEVRKVNWKYTPAEKRLFQIILVPWWTYEEAMNGKGRDPSKPGTDGNHAIIDVDAMHRTDGERAAMRNPKIISPVPRDLKEIHLVRGPNWGKIAGVDY